MMFDSGNEDGEEEMTTIPQHPLLELKHECVQRFNRWSRRLLVYQRLPSLSGETSGINDLTSVPKFPESAGNSGDDLNHFRKRYFQAFVDRNRQ